MSVTRPGHRDTRTATGPKETSEVSEAWFRTQNSLPERKRNTGPSSPSIRATEDVTPPTGPKRGERARGRGGRGPPWPQLLSPQTPRATNWSQELTLTLQRSWNLVGCSGPKSLHSTPLYGLWLTYWALCKSVQSPKGPT